MKIRQLRFLVAVVEYGGVIKAAERLHISQPSISAGLKALEQDLGSPLFDRSAPANRPLRLTPAGRRFYRAAVEILSLCDAARADFLGETEDKPRVRLGFLDTLPQKAIVDMLGALRKREPHVQLDVWEGSAERVAGWLARERIDIAWSNVNDLTPNARLLWREPLVAVVAPAHPYAKAHGRITLRDLENQPFMHRSRCELDAVGRAQLKAASVALRVAARAEREELAFRLVRHAQGITLAPRSLVPDDLVALQVTGLDVARSIGLQWGGELDPALLGAIIDSAEEAALSIRKSQDAARKRRGGR